MIRRPPRSTLFPTRRSSDLDVTATSAASGTFCSTISEAKMVEAETRKQPENLAKEAVSDLIISISTKTMVELFLDRKSTRLNSSHDQISYAVFCLKKKKIVRKRSQPDRWVIGPVPLGKVANKEKKLPRAFRRQHGIGLTGDCRRSLEPLLAGELAP